MTRHCFIYPTEWNKVAIYKVAKHTECWDDIFQHPPSNQYGVVFGCFQTIGGSVTFIAFRNITNRGNGKGFVNKSAN